MPELDRQTVVITEEIVARAKRLSDTGQQAAAVELLEKAIKEHPFSRQQTTSYPPQLLHDYHDLSLALLEIGCFKAAAQGFRKVLEYKPDLGLAISNLGVAHERMGNEKDALECYIRAASYVPDNLTILLNAASRLAVLGSKDEAKKYLESAIRINPCHAAAHHSLSCIKKYTKDDPYRGMIEQALREPSLTIDDRIHLYFSLGKAWDDAGEYEKAFLAFKRGNRLKRSTFIHEDYQFWQYNEEVMQHFKYDATSAAPSMKETTPIFIIGMPRSGTTLVEQILASHSAVHGGGELPYFFEMLQTAGKTDKNSFDYAYWLHQAGESDFARIGNGYLEKLKTLAPDTAFLTDKMPWNFIYTGFIRKAIPNAKIIHVIREPRDICLSIYTMLFTYPTPFAYTQEEIARYYNFHRHLMNQWKKTLPAGSVFEVRYEDIVSDVKGQTRRLLEYCGLPWEDNCLNFYENDRPVRTASRIQVRQPIYPTSVGKWKNYEPFLEPLTRTLENET
jgi:tetratricopeptide (TPR) repeat protein